jgi:hypothetical protein
VPNSHHGFVLYILLHHVPYFCAWGPFPGLYSAGCFFFADADADLLREKNIVSWLADFG